jgi:hypothetical protein
VRARVGCGEGEDRYVHRLTLFVADAAVHVVEAQIAWAIRNFAQK